MIPPKVYHQLARQHQEPKSSVLMYEKSQNKLTSSPILPLHPQPFPWLNVKGHNRTMTEGRI